MIPPELLELSIIIPAYNESGRIGATLEKVSDYIQGRDFPTEILVCDDGSRDHTRKVVEEFAGKATLPIKLLGDDINRGKGHAVRIGMLQARGRQVLFTDADLSTPIEEVEHLQAAIQAGADLAFGSRALRDSRILVHQRTHRELSGKAFNLLVQALLLPGIHDTQCGFKLFTREAAQEIFSRAKIDGFSFDVEILHLARKLGLKLKEVPVIWVNSPDSRLNFLSDPARMFADLVRIRLNHYS